VIAVIACGRVVNGAGGEFDDGECEGEEVFVRDFVVY
jgi:hypothetical protein